MSEQKLSERNAKIAAAKAELEASEKWMQDIPLDCDPLDIVRHKTVVQFWPERIQKLVEKRN